MNDKTMKKCKKCGKLLPLDQYYDNGSAYVARCKKCSIEASQITAEKKRKYAAMDAAGIKIFTIERMYKTIYKERILIQDTIPLIAEDEIFVSVMDCPHYYISNYGRLLHEETGTYRLMQGSIEKGRRRYSVMKNMRRNNAWINSRRYVFADSMVVHEFIVNPDCVDNKQIFHCNGDLQDCYYKNLYPLNKKQYEAAEKLFSQQEAVSEPDMITLINDRKYLPDWMSNRIMEKTVCGRGYAGCTDRDSYCQSYRRWLAMMHRCYNPNPRQETYKDCTVNPEWFNYRNYRDWYDTHMYQLGTTTMSLDKDILIRGNKEYSASACAIVPVYVNSSVSIYPKDGNQQLPVGIAQDEQGYYVMCPKKLSKAHFDTPEEAFEIYKEYNERKLQKLAESLKGHMPLAVYESLMKWEIKD